MSRSLSVDQINGLYFAARELHEPWNAAYPAPNTMHSLERRGLVHKPAIRWFLTALGVTILARITEHAALGMTRANLEDLVN